ncbi:MAG: 50S ribosomal protein L29 [Chloroflexi bacterium]|nr:50S ribosomal protein L29 [Chloroflexota bacterium]
MARKSRERVDDLRGLTDEDLAKELEETHRQLFTARLQLSTRQLANTSLARQTRHRLAQIKTIQRERELAQLYEQAAGAES